MRTNVAAVLAIASLAACSGSVTVPAASTSSISGSASSADDLKLAISGIAPRYFSTIKGEIHRLRARQRKPVTMGQWNPDLFVDEGATRVVDAYRYTTAQQWNNYYGDINGSAGISDPNGNWYGVGGVSAQPKWLFVTNSLAGNVQEYKNGQSTGPSFTFTSGLVDPVNVTSDKQSNVYVADYGGGFVNKYAVSSNTVTAQCFPGGSVEGVAVNSTTGDVFVSYNDGANVGHIIMYTSFLSGCNGTAVATSVSFGTVGGIILDPSGRLLICDQTNSKIDRLTGAGYNTVSGTYGLGTVSDPLHATLNRTGSNTANRLYVSDPAADTVWVFTYPAGALQSKLDSNTIPPVSVPMGAVRYKNFNS
jgi:hypothetical protein